MSLCYNSIAETSGDEDLPLNEEEWKKLACHLKIEPDSETMKEKCFEMAYQACLQGEWSQIDAALPLKLLHDKGANKMTKDPSGRDPVHFAVLGHHPHVLEWLASYDWPLDERAQDRKSPQDLLADGDPLKGILRNLILQKRTGGPFDPKQYPPENAIFQGGSPKWMAYAGVLEKLERRALGDIKRIAGTSAGAITAVLVALDFSDFRFALSLFLF